MPDLTAHEDTVSALEWLPDGSGFLSGGLDRKIIHWVSVAFSKLSYTLSDH